MSSLADLPELIRIFSYSGEDDEAYEGTLSAIRDAIQRELSAQLGRYGSWRGGHGFTFKAPMIINIRLMMSRIDQEFNLMVTIGATNRLYRRFD